MSEPGRQPQPAGGDERPPPAGPAQPEPGPQSQPPPPAADAPQDAGFAAPGPAAQPPQMYAFPAPPPFPYGYPPPQYSPYGMPPPYGYPPAQRPPTNGIALAGLLTAIFFWPAGLVLSAIGLRKSRQLAGAGRGQAIAGLVIAPISAAITVLIAIGLFAAATAISDANGSMFGDATGDPGCALILSSLAAVPGEMQGAAAGPQAAIAYLNGLDESVQNAENAAVDVEVSDDLGKVDGDIGSVTEDLQAIVGGGSVASTGVDGDIAELDTDSGALQSLCTGASAG